MPRAKVTDFVVTNGAKLSYERQGVGQALLFIAGSTGDAGNFTRVADLLADEFTVVTYDRRGNSRSERPAGWTKTSVSEQADDARSSARWDPPGAVLLFRVAQPRGRSRITARAHRSHAQDERPTRNDRGAYALSER
jgi:pimeloyl-ACP methyl ester carboxylesterase